MLFMHRDSNLALPASKLVFASSRHPSHCGCIEPTASLSVYRGNNLVVATSSQPLNFGFIEASSSLGLHQGNNHIVAASNQPLWLYRGKCGCIKAASSLLLHRAQPFLWLHRGNNLVLDASRPHAHCGCIETNHSFFFCIEATFSLWLN